jgi:serine phosphatase RsbU (regulator of sigma subunit)
MSALPSQLSPAHLETLYQIFMTMNSSLEFDSALDNVIDAMMRITRAERGVLMGYDESSGALRLLGARGISGERLTEEEAYSTTIVNQVVQTRQALLTNNATLDPRITPGQSIILRGLRAILCAPMLVQERLVGVVYVDTSMRTGNFTDADRDLLSAIANQAGITLENARLYSVAIEKGRLERELQLAREIQEGLLPRHKPRVPGYQVEAIWQSAREMAGDFYDYFTLSKDHFGVVIADVSDKGAASALFMAVARSMIRSYAFAGYAPLDTIAQTNNLILEDAESGMFVTVFHSVFHHDGRSSHINAGHNPPLLYRAQERAAQFLPRGGRAVGWFAENPLVENQITLQPGDFLLYYTDGLTDCENAAGEPFGEARLKALADTMTNQSAASIVQTVVESVSAFIGDIVPFDDVTLMVIRYTG